VNGASTLDRHGESIKQAAVADRIVLTKTDLPEADTSGLRGRLNALNPTAPLLTAVQGDIAPRWLFDGGVYDPSAKPADVQAWLAAEPHAHGHQHDINRHDDDIRAHSMVRERPIHAVTLTLFLEILAEHCGPDLLRMKGLVKLVESSDQPAVIHGVQNVFHPPVWLDHWPGVERNSKLVFITKDLPGVWFEELLDALDAEVAEAHERQMLK
jgi:G3E family GTPase